MSDLKIVIKNGEFVIGTGTVMVECEEACVLEFDCQSKYPDSGTILVDELGDDGLRVFVYPGLDSIKLDTASAKIATCVEISGLPFKVGYGKHNYILDASRYTIRFAVWKISNKLKKWFFADDKPVNVVAKGGRVDEEGQENVKPPHERPVEGGVESGPDDCGD